MIHRKYRQIEFCCAAFVSILLLLLLLFRSIVVFRALRNKQNKQTNRYIIIKFREVDQHTSRQTSEQNVCLSEREAAEVAG